MLLPNFIRTLPVHRHIGDSERIDHLTLIQDDDAGLTLVDTGLPGSETQVLAALAQAGVQLDQIKNIILTHADLDHAGLARFLRDQTGAALWASAVEARYISGELPFYKPLSEDVLAGFPADFAQQLREGIPPVEINHELVDGQTLAFAHGAQVIATPGHTPGHVSLFFPDESVLISADAVMLQDGELIFPRLSLDDEEALRSVARVAALKPRVLVAQHGGLYLQDPAAGLARVLAAGLLTQGTHG